MTNETFFAAVSGDPEHPFGELQRSEGAQAAATLDQVRFCRLFYPTGDLGYRRIRGAEG